MKLFGQPIAKSLKEIRLTIRFYFYGFASIVVDPIEQYEITFSACDMLKIYPAQIHGFVILAILIYVASRADFSPAGYVNGRIYSFVKSLFIASFGYEKQKLFPFFYYVFLFILISNVLGMFPGSFTLTAQLSVATFFSVVGFGGLIFLSIEQRGGRFFELFSPTAPAILLPFLIVIEFISFLMRFVSLSVRLFANMVAGHALLKILLLFFVTIVQTMGTFAIIGGVFGFFLILAVVALEVLIAVLQAYVFVFLLLVYAKELL